MSDVALSLEARRAALAGTREMIRQDEFSALVTALVAANAVPCSVMEATLRTLADGLIAKARDQMEADFQIYPAELFDRAMSLTALAARLHRPCQT